jgi:hypothetical protein
MTDTPPVDTAPSTDTPEDRETFARAMAEALGEWVDAPDWQRRAIGAIAPRLARGLYLADLTIDAMIGDAERDEGETAALLAVLIGLPEPEPLLARLGRCTEMIALPDDGTFAYCATRLVGTVCPFAVHHAPPPVTT